MKLLILSLVLIAGCNLCNDCEPEIIYLNQDLTQNHEGDFDFDGFDVGKLVHTKGFQLINTEITKLKYKRESNMDLIFVDTYTTKKGYRNIKTRARLTIVIQRYQTTDSNRGKIYKIDIKYSDYKPDYKNRKLFPQHVIYMSSLKFPYMECDFLPNDHIILPNGKLFIPKNIQYQWYNNEIDYIRIESNFNTSNRRFSNSGKKYFSYGQFVEQALHPKVREYLKYTKVK